MIVREDFYMLPRFNEVLQRAIEAGLIQKWRRDFQLHNSKPTENNEHIVLTLAHTYGAFGFLIFFLTLALFGFMSEHLMYSYMTSNRHKEKRSMLITLEKCVYIPQRVYCVNKKNP